MVMPIIGNLTCGQRADLLVVKQVFVGGGCNCHDRHAQVIPAVGGDLGHIALVSLHYEIENAENVC